MKNKYVLFSKLKHIIKLALVWRFFYVFRIEQAIMVLFLFCAASTLNINKDNTIQTSASNSKLLPIYNVQTNENKVAFTMNCAWNADDIDKILDVLKSNNIKITFFMVGDWIDKFPEAVRKINDEGHEIASHSNTHPHVNNLSYEENINEIEESSKKIENITGEKTNIYRPPYGEYNDTVIKSAKDKGYYCIQWSLDTLDYTGIAGEEMWNKLESKIQKGDIILSHNGTKHTADSLDMLIKNIKNKELEIVPVSELVYKDNYTINSNGTQIRNK